MGKVLKNISLMDRTYSFYKKEGNLVVYKYEDKQNNELILLEIKFDENDIVESIHLQHFKNGNSYETMDITKNSYGKVSMEYKPEEKEIISINSHDRLYNVTISKSVDINDLDRKSTEIKLSHDGEDKLLIKVLCDDYCITKGKRICKIFNCESLNKLERLTEYISLELLEIEERLKKQEQTIDISDNGTQVCLEDEVYDVSTDFVSSLYVYDRIYNIIGLRSNVLLYRNTEDGIQDLEITFSLDMSKIMQVRIIRYKDNLMNSSIKTYEHIIDIKRQDDGYIYTKYISKEPGYMHIESPVLNEKMIELGSFGSIKFSNLISNDVIDTTREISTGFIEFDTKFFGHFKLEKDKSRRHYYIDENGNEYFITQSNFAVYDSISSSPNNILNSMENKLINNEQKGRQIVKEKL